MTAPPDANKRQGMSIPARCGPRNGRKTHPWRATHITRFEFQPVSAIAELSNDADPRHLTMRSASGFRESKKSCKICGSCCKRLQFLFRVLFAVCVLSVWRVKKHKSKGRLMQFMHLSPRTNASQRLLECSVYCIVLALLPMLAIPLERARRKQEPGALFCFAQVE